MRTGAESVFAHVVHNAQHMGALKDLLSEQIPGKTKWESQPHHLVLYTAKFKVCGCRFQNPGLEEISNQQEEQDAVPPSTNPQTLCLPLQWKEAPPWACVLEAGSRVLLPSLLSQPTLII